MSYSVMRLAFCSAALFFSFGVHSLVYATPNGEQCLMSYYLPTPDSYLDEIVPGGTYPDGPFQLDPEPNSLLVGGRPQTPRGDHCTGQIFTDFDYGRVSYVGSPVADHYPNTLRIAAAYEVTDVGYATYYPTIPLGRNLRPSVTYSGCAPVDSLFSTHRVVGALTNTPLLRVTYECEYYPAYNQSEIYTWLTYYRYNMSHARFTVAAVSVFLGDSLISLGVQQVYSLDVTGDDDVQGALLDPEQFLSNELVPRLEVFSAPFQQIDLLPVDVSPSCPTVALSTIPDVVAYSTTERVITGHHPESREPIYDDVVTPIITIPALTISSQPACDVLGGVNPELFRSLAITIASIFIMFKAFFNRPT